MYSRNSLLRNFTRRRTEPVEPSSDSVPPSSGYNEALVGVKLATATLTEMKEKREKIEANKVISSSLSSIINSKVQDRFAEKSVIPTKRELPQPTSAPDNTEIDNKILQVSLAILSKDLFLLC